MSENFNTIISIIEVDRPSEYVDHKGWKIETDRGTYFAIKTRYTNCCEEHGGYSSRKDLAHFVGAAMDEPRFTTEINRVDGQNYDNKLAIHLETSKGSLQLVFYNDLDEDTHGGDVEDGHAHIVTLVSPSGTEERDL